MLCRIQGLELAKPRNSTKQIVIYTIMLLITSTGAVLIGNTFNTLSVKQYIFVIVTLCIAVQTFYEIDGFWQHTVCLAKSFAIAYTLITSFQILNILRGILAI